MIKENLFNTYKSEVISSRFFSRIHLTGESVPKTQSTQL